MNSSTLRQLWTVVEDTHSSVLLRLSDTDLVKQLLLQLDSKKPLSSEETNTVSAYIHSRKELIRDLALSRLA